MRVAGLEGTGHLEDPGAIAAGRGCRVLPDSREAVLVGWVVGCVAAAVVFAVPGVGSVLVIEVALGVVAGIPAAAHLSGSAVQLPVPDVNNTEAGLQVLLLDTHVRGSGLVDAEHHRYTRGKVVLEGVRVVVEGVLHLE